MEHFNMSIGSLETTFRLERTRLLKLCISLTGNPETAEDLTQETLLEAWRHLDTLRDPARFQQWLSGIAYNVYRRWSRSQGHEQAHLLTLSQKGDDSTPTLEDLLLADTDIEVELERKELIELLDRSLALLPADTRTILIERYVKESPLAEVAEHLGSSRDAVAMRLHRGKLALKRLLHQDTSFTEHLHRDDENQWEQTRIWCTNCGQQKLMGRIDSSQDVLQMHCPSCELSSNTGLTQSQETGIFKNVKSFKPATNRLLAFVHRYYSNRLDPYTIPCLYCGRPTSLERTFSTENASYHAPGFFNHCHSCQVDNWTSLDSMLLALPEGQQFWKEHPRIRTLPQSSLEVEGQDALLTTLESVTETHKLTFITSRENFEILSIYKG